MSLHATVSTPRRRFFLATVLWIIFWPALRFIQLGDITGPQAFFWITGMMNYLVAAPLFSIADGIFSRFLSKPWLIFLACAIATGLTVPLYHQRVGNTFGVFVDAFLF